jgi:hypothetical protein
LLGPAAASGDAGPPAGLTGAAKPEGTVRAVVQRADMRVALLHAGEEAAEVERMLGRPTTTTILDEPAGDKRLLVYANEPVRAQVTLAGGRVTAIALEPVHIDIALLPAHARMVKPTMVRGGVLALLGRPSKDESWLASGLKVEQMVFTRADESDFSVFLADGVVVDVKPAAERPSDIEHVILPHATPDTAVGPDLSIGLTPEQAASLLGPAVWTPINSTFKGQPVLSATYHERGGCGFVSLTFTGGVLTAFAIWPGDTALDLAGG